MLPCNTVQLTHQQNDFPCYLWHNWYHGQTTVLSVISCQIIILSCQIIMSSCQILMLSFSDLYVDLSLKHLLQNKSLKRVLAQYLTSWHNILQVNIKDLTSRHHYLTSRHNFPTGGQNDLTSGHNYLCGLFKHLFDSSDVISTCQIVMSTC